ncbi:hypothetical protein HS088_TW11G01065 [Tripterygium wilfordii]|uniref:PsbP C-terminal domain-containing protein n=1 Tax=Tripterygium wilfordii TaxID=458696 RepID=A0A7J7D3T7_TRIWF|nr:psbP domain-containing protein 3, chloroplastic [Tripterygium wilfordii]KAF5740983.1 hypothetical protein HS088_TW11G01065 [Tripterygium wilfordii]
MASLTSLSHRPHNLFLKSFSNNNCPCSHRVYAPLPAYISSCTSICRSNQQALCCNNNGEEERKGEPSTKRREVLLKTGFTAAAFSFPAVVYNASAENDVLEDFRTYVDEVNKFKISIPQDWQVGTGEPNGFKSVTAFYPDEASISNVSVVITGLGPDYTRMESFGKVEGFAETLVSGLDRSWQRPPGVAAKLIDCKASNGFYYVDYTLQKPGENRKHLFQAIGMAFNGWYNRLYTVTGQFVDEESGKYASKIKKAVASFKFT